jgi:DNA polymerase (family 10)
MAGMNDAVAALLREYAELTLITGGDQFRVRNYERAAKSIAGHPADIAGLSDAQLRAIPGVGKSIAGKVTEFRDTGSFRALDELRTRIPAGVRELTKVPGLGPRRALQLNADLGIETVGQLAQAVRDGKLRDLDGFGIKSEERILRGLSVMGTGRATLKVALETATGLVEALSPLAQRCEYAGSLRRWRESIGDIDILAATADPDPVTAAFAGLGTEVLLVSGPTKTTIRTASGLRADLRVVEPGVWGAAWQYFTGSQAHNVAVRAHAVKNGLKLSEYGLFRGTDCLASATEEQVYAALGMQWVPPPLREDTGEVQAALRGELPSLVELGDVRGDLHTHTNLTDGVASLTEMIRAAERRGYEYYAVTDHAPDLVMQRMTDEKMLAQRTELRTLTSSMKLLHGTELNIAPDGSVDWDGDFLAAFDIRVASVHSHFDQPRAQMTRRFITACENPWVNIIGHPLTRKFGRRPPVEVDFGELFRACARTGTALEINASPERLDLPAEHIRAARDAGVTFAISTDAHSIPHLDNMRYGVGTAQRGWLTAADVINTWPLDQLLTFVTRGSRG